MDNISEHISYEEAIKSQTAIRLSIDNIPTEDILAAMRKTASNIFEPLRFYVSQARGKESPLTISSFYRCPELNKAIGGSSTSQHCKGEAIDIEVFYLDFTKANLFVMVKEKLPFDQLIWEGGDDIQPAWVHVSYSSQNRRQVLKMIIKDGVSTYIPFP